MIAGEVVREPFERVLQRVRGEFTEMPCLKLTAAQAQRLCGIKEDTWASVSQHLLEQGFLRQTASGAFALKNS
ncbi:MAG: hypothetical protein ACM3KM_01090 [Acidobacteriaceae bacterium]